MEFQDAVTIVLAFEGGGRIVSHPKDPGGLTKFGISLRAHPQLGEAGIRNLTREKAIEILWKSYWIPLRLGRLPERLSLPLFDAAVNHGLDGAGELLQMGLNRIGAGLKVDGVIGKDTVKAVAGFTPAQVVSAELCERLHFYRRLRTYETFGDGWDKRIIDVALCA